MKRMQDRMVLGLAVSLVLGGVCHAETTTEYKPERYNVILERSPFGDPLSTAVSTPDANAQAQKAAAALEQAYRLSFLLESETGEIRAGFQNLKPKQGEPISSVVMVGESFMGMKLKSIDLVNSSATLEHNGRPVIFQLTKQKALVNQVPATTAANQRKMTGGFRRSTPQPKPAQPQLTPAEQQQRREEIRKNLQSYQMEVIRKGMPPLPVPLTQEMDDQLVSEGVLPPTQ